MVTTFYPPYSFGGDAVFVRALSQALVAEGHTVEVVHCEDAYRLRGRELADPGGANRDGVVIHRLRDQLGLLSLLITHQTGQPGLKRHALRRILEKGFDVIHFHNISLLGGPGVLAMGAAPVKLYTAHEHWLVCPTHVLWKNRRQPCDQPQCIQCCLRSGIPLQLWRYTGLVQRSLKQIDALLIPSQFATHRHQEGGIDCPIHVLPTFTDIQIPPLPPSEPPRRPHFVYAGRLTLSKGVVELVDQFARFPQYDLTIAGDGELMKMLRRRIEDCPNICLAGSIPREQLLRLYQQATAVILPCVGPEVFPLVVLEAMACGTPVIVREAGGSAEAVRATGGGVMYHDRDGLCQAIRQMAANPAWRQSLAHKARVGYERYYTPEVHLRRYSELIGQIQATKRQVQLVQ
jgi:glycosyltransferase involved in cell wall biosynthesis